MNTVYFIFFILLAFCLGLSLGRIQSPYDLVKITRTFIHTIERQLTIFNRQAVIMNLLYKMNKIPEDKRNPHIIRFKKIYKK